jgi:hypothetical protein
LFGRIGFGLLGLGACAMMSVVAMKIFSGIDMTGNPLLLLGVMLGLMSLQALSVGLIGESTTRLYYNRNARRPFTIREILGRRSDENEEPAPVLRMPATAASHRAA